MKSLRVHESFKLKLMISKTKVRNKKLFLIIEKKRRQINTQFIYRLMSYLLESLYVFFRICSNLCSYR